VPESRVRVDPGVVAAADGHGPAPRRFGRFGREAFTKLDAMLIRTHAGSESVVEV
jgi:hypothetical protein